MKIVLLSGTNRPDSNTRKVVAQLETIYTALGYRPVIVDLAELPQEIFLPASYGTKPASFARFNDAILTADGLHVVTPEYNGGMPGVLKYFIDMLKFPESFERRPVCFVGVAAGMWGALRPIEQLQAIFGYRNAFLYPERVFMPGINDLLDEKGQITDADILKRLTSQAQGFIEFVEKLKGVKLRR